MVRGTVYENGGQLPDAPGDGPVVGVDVGIKVLAFTSDGEEYDNPRWFRRGERKPRRINKAIARSINLNPNRRTNRRGRLYEQRQGCNLGNNINVRRTTGRLHPR